MPREIIRTDQAPQAIGTYSQAVRVGRTVYLSGQIPLDPLTMELADGDVEAQIRRVFGNLQAVARGAGGGLADVVKLNVFLTDLAPTTASHWPLRFLRVHQYCQYRRGSLRRWSLGLRRSEMLAALK